MRALQVLVIAMGVLIVVGVAVIGVEMSRRLGGVAGGMAATVLDEPAGTRIAGASAAGERMLVRLQGGGPDRVAVVDLRSGKVVGQVGLAR